MYGHPELLAVAAAVNGEDFAPFNEALFFKEPGLGASVAWHRDGVTHWDRDDWDVGDSRLQLHGPALRVYAGERGVGRARFTQGSSR